MKLVFSQFLALGFTILSSHLSYANDIDNTSIKNDITNNVHKIIDEQIIQGYLTEKASISITIAPSVQTHLKQLEAIYKPETPYIEGINVSTNARATLVHGNKTFAKMANTGKCDIALVYDDQGGVESLTDDITTLIETEFKNSEQKKIGQQFIALHEQFHCEFNKIQTPVLIDPNNMKFNQTLTYILRDQKSPFKEPVTYLDILNENFADVSAAIVLIQKYGKDNKNLLYVLNSLQTQRHDKYFKDNEAVHSTHFSLAEVLQENTLNNISKDLTPESFQLLSLTIANKGVGQVISHRPIIAERIFSSNNIIRGVFINILAMVTYDNASLEKKTTIFNNPWGKDVQQGLAVDIATDLLKDEDTKKMDFFDKNGNIKNTSILFAYINNLIANKKMSPQIVQLYQQCNSAMQTISKDVLSSSNKSSFDYIEDTLSNKDLHVKKQIVLQNFISLREKLLEQSSFINQASIKNK